MKLANVFTTLFKAELKTVLKVEKLQNKSAKEIIEIWNTFHCSLSQSVSIVMNQNKRDVLTERLIENPLFMQPIIRNPHFFFVYSHMGEGEKLIYFYPMTQQIEDPLNVEFCFLLRIFDELLESHGIYLVRGDIIDKFLSKSEAEQVMRGLIGHYVENDLFEDYVKPFNFDISSFNHHQFLKDYTTRFVKKPEE